MKKVRNRHGICTRYSTMGTASSTASVRLEDVFQDEITVAFGDIKEFKKFARSKYGLCLKESDIQGILDDNRSSTDQKMGMLNIWRRKNGKEATVSGIRYLVERYHKRDAPKNYKSLRENMFGVFLDQPLCKRGHVCRGEQISTVTGSIPRAIKMIPYNEWNFREAEILSKLGPHKNVVSTIHVDAFHGDPYDYIYMVMELAWSEHLRDVLQASIKSKTVLDDNLVISMAVQITKALAFIHEYNVIHRDLKPENILISDDRKHLKLTDFGISKKITDGSYTKQTDSNAGTDGYRATEAYNSNVISQKSDIFSAGITFAELFSNGRHPFGDDPDLWKYNIKNYKNLDTSHIIVANTTQAKNLIIHMLQLIPDERPTALEVLNFLELFGQPQNLGDASRNISDASNAEKKTQSELQLSEKLQVLSVRKKTRHPTSPTKKIQNQVERQEEAQVPAKLNVLSKTTQAEGFDKFFMSLAEIESVMSSDEEIWEYVEEYPDVIAL